jgi:hypothetical protein
MSHRCLAAAAHLAAIFQLTVFSQGIASREVQPTPRPKASGRPFSKFVDISRDAGLTTPIYYGGVNRTDYLTETSSGGVAFVDLNGDSKPDLFFTGGPKDGNLLYLNRGKLPLEDVSAKAGVREPGWASAVAAGDYDGDGALDLLVTYWGRVALFRNRGQAMFEEVAEKAGLPSESHWYSGATFFDFDRDGDLDLFLATYAGLDITRVPKPGENPNCNWKGIAVPCGPRGLPTGRRFLFRNEGGGKFRDATTPSGVNRGAPCYGMTAVSFDVDGDGWLDIYLACDSTASLLFLNNHDGTFREEGIERGLALSDDGREQAGMGIAVGDIDLDGDSDILKTHFADDAPGLYRDNGKGEFTDTALAAGLGVETRMVGWGAGIEDFDNDALPDLFVATGNVYPETATLLPSYPYMSPPLLFRNLGGVRFELIDLPTRASSRGCSFADFDDDGDVDIAIWNRNAPPTLLRNDSPRANHWIRIVLEGRALGAAVTVRYGKRSQVRHVLSQASFYSVNDLRLHFGFGVEAGPVDVSAKWPGGHTQTWRGLAVDREHRLADGQAIPK